MALSDAESDADLSGIPFGGADRVLSFRDDEIYEWEQAIKTLMGGCGHLHNFMVEGDGKRLYTSRLGAECVKKVLGL